MAPKKQKNAFSFYLDQYVETERQKGRHISFRIAAEECAPVWKVLPEELKEKFKKMAAMHKEYRKFDKENKLTSTGVSVGELEKQQLEMRLKTEEADFEMTSTIFDLDTDSQEGTYVPGELAVVEFSLQSGIRRTFHTLINPGPIPLGYAFDAKNRIENIHGLPYPPYDEGESDYFGLLDKILHFLEPGKLADGKYPPLYCLESNVSASENILQTLSENSTEGVNFFRVFFLHKMFFWLKNKSIENVDEENVGFHVMANAESELSKDIFRYVPGISCSFHAASEEMYHNCSLSVVQRQVYLICDHCCQYVGVTLVPGQHCRLKADVNRKSDKWEAQKRKWFSPNSAEVMDVDYDGHSSYGGELSCGGWKEGGENRCSFLHDELDTRFNNLEVSSVASGSCAHSVGSGKWKRVESEEDSVGVSDTDFIKVMHLGRGTSRR